MIFLGNLYADLSTKLFESIQKKDIEQMQRIVKTIDSEITPEEIPDDDKIILEKVKKLLTNHRNNQGTFIKLIH